MTHPFLIQPFRGLRPAPGQAAEVAAPPYDVVDAEEARRLIADRPNSFLRISRAEVELPAGTDPYDPSVYARARANLERIIDDGVLHRDASPHFYVYRLDTSTRSQTGLVASASVTAYTDGRIKKHELTRPTKEDDRVRQIDALDAQTGPVFLVHRASERLRTLLAEASQGRAPDIDIQDTQGVRHRLWPVSAPDQVQAIADAGNRLSALYVADGHHRSAAAVRVAARRGLDERAGFLAVIFPQDELVILPYHRLILDLGELDTGALLARAGEAFHVQRAEGPLQPTSRGCFGLYDGRDWWRLDLHEDRLPTRSDPVERLAVSLLHRHLVAPILGITDARRDSRIDFVGGSRGLDGLAAPVDAGRARIAISVPATSIDELLAVADADAIMPPKSTWFEPKLADGLVSLVLD